MNFGDNSLPRYIFTNMDNNFIVFELFNDNILEGTESGRVQIVQDSNVFDGYEPLYKDVTIVLKDDESIIHHTDLLNL